MTLTAEQQRQVALERPAGVAWRLAAAGLALNALLAGLILLYANFPPGYDAPYGLSLDSLPLFRALWSYPALVLRPNTFATLAVLLFGLPWFVCRFGARVVGDSPRAIAPRQALAIIVLAGLLANVMLVLFFPPVLSSDIYNYGLYGRMITTYQLNPYVATPMTVPDDPFVEFIHWRTVSTRYGPVWTLLSIPPAAFGSQNVLVTVLAFKAVAAVFNLVNGLLVFLLARRLTGGDGVVPLLLYAWNPLILIETAGNGHNDAVMMTFALLGMLLVVRKRLLLGVAFLTLSVLVKYVTAFLLLFVAIRALAGLSTSRERAYVLVRMGAIVAAIVGVSYLPFVLASEGLQQFLTAAAPLVNAVRNPIHVLLQNAATSVLANGGDRESAQAVAETYLGWVLYAILVLLIALMARAIVVQKPTWSQVVERWGVASLFYLILVYGGMLPWYLISPLTTTFVVPLTRTNRALALVTIGLGILWTFGYALLFAP